MSAVVNLVLGAAGAPAVVSAIKSVSGALGGMATAASAASAVAASLVTGVQEVLDAAGRLSDLSARTGQSVRDLVVLERAYKNSGLASEYVAQSIGLVQRALGGLNEEGGKTAEVWARLGLNQQRLKQMSFSDQLREISAAFSTIANPAERTATAMSLFGKSGAQMLQILGDPEALATAESEAGRLADKLQANAKRFDEIGDKLSVVKLRLLEMSLSVAERLTPALETAVAVLQRMNLSVLGAVLPELMTTVGLLGGAKFAKSVVTKLDEAVLSWAKNPNGAIGQRFAARFLAPLTGSLATVLPVGLAAAVAAQILLGIHTAWRQYQDEKLQRSGDAVGSSQSIAAKASGIRSDQDRQRLLAEAFSKYKEIQDLKRAELSSFWTNDQAVGAYDTALRSLVGTMTLLDGEWAAQKISANKAADAAAAAAEKFAKAEASAKEWMSGDGLASARKKLSAADWASMQPSSQVVVAEGNLFSHDGQSRRDEDALQKSGAVSQLEKARIQNAVRRLELLDELRLATKALADEEATKERNALEAERARIEREKTALDADFSRSESDKWNARLALLAQAAAASEKYLAAMRAARASATPETKAFWEKNVRDAEGDTAAASGALASVGPSPSSYADQVVSANTAAVNSIGTLQQQVGRLWGSTAESIRTSMGGALGDMMLTTGSWSDKARAAMNSVYTSVVRGGAQMVADWIMKHTIMAVVGKVFRTQEVVGHGTMEAAKTGFTLKGFLLRMGTHIKEAMASVYKAGAGALSALSAIPVVGPILGVAAMAAVIAAGIGVARKIGGGFYDGGYTARSSSDRTPFRDIYHANEWVAPAWLVRDREASPLIDYLEDKRQRKGLGSGTPASGYSLGGWINKITGVTKKLTGWDSIGQWLGSGFVPRWLQPKSFQKFQENYNLLDGKALYGYGNNPDSLYFEDGKWTAGGRAVDGLAAAGATSAASSAGSSSAGTAVAGADPTASGKVTILMLPGFTRSECIQYLKSRDGQRIIADGARNTLSEI